MQLLEEVHVINLFGIKIDNKQAERTCRGLMQKGE